MNSKDSFFNNCDGRLHKYNQVRVSTFAWTFFSEDFFSSSNMTEKWSHYTVIYPLITFHQTIFPREAESSRERGKLFSGTTSDWLFLSNFPYVFHDWKNWSFIFRVFQDTWALFQPCKWPWPWGVLLLQNSWIVLILIELESQKCLNPATVTVQQTQNVNSKCSLLARVWNAGKKKIYVTNGN